jgi:hypothetical protein
MFPILIGLIAAALFGVAATVTLGPEALMTHAWVDIIFWTFISTGAAVSAVNISWECIPCRLARSAKRLDLTDRLCAKAPCHH